MPSIWPFGRNGSACCYWVGSAIAFAERRCVHRSTRDCESLDRDSTFDASLVDRYTINVIGDNDDVAIAAITVAELQVGVRLVSGRRRAQRQSYVDDVCDVIPILAYDRSVAEEHADLLVAVRQAGRSRGAHDLIIAATARASKRTLVSADLTAFTDLPGVMTIDHR
jgi:tRNA(fMet)-specific endonuclease VapC